MVLRDVPSCIVSPGLFNDALSIETIIDSDRRITANNELGMIWKEAVTTQLRWRHCS
jgi:hypothetical protein